MMKKEAFFIRYRWSIIVSATVICLLMIIPLFKAKLNTDLNSYLPKGIPEKVNIEKLEAVFGKTDPIVIFIESQDILDSATLERVRNLSNAFTQRKEFNHVISLFQTKNIKSEDGIMVVDPAIANIPGNYQEKEDLRRSLISNPLAFKLLVSEDFHYTMIILNPVNISDKQAMKLVDSILGKYPGKEKIYLNGTPYMRNEIMNRAVRDLVLLMPLGLTAMLVFLFISFREWKAVLLPFSVVIMSIIIAMGLMPLFGYEFSLIAVLIPILMIAIANNYGVYIVSRYQEYNAKHRDRSMKQIVTNAFSHLYRPIILTALTTVVGILGMVFTHMLPARQMGIVCSIGITFSLILSLFFIPAILAFLKKGKPHKSFTHEKHNIIDTLLDSGSKWVVKSPRTVIVVFGIFLVAATSGIISMQVSINNEKMLHASHPLRISTSIANEHFSGTRTISLLYEGDIMDPEVLRAMEKFEENIKKAEGVGNVTSLVTVIKSISRALNPTGDSLYDKIPSTREGIAQYLELYNMSGNPADLEQLVNFDYTEASLSVQFTAKDIRNFNRVNDEIGKLASASPFFKLKAGNCLVEKEFAESIVNGQIVSLLFAFIAIILLMWWIFRSLPAGLLGSIPLAFTILCNFGIMGWLGFELDIANSLLSSIAIGLGVDFTIHIFWRFMAELSDGKSHSDAVITALKTTGRGITINALAVMLGFAVLFLSEITLLNNFALLIILSLLLCLLCALLLIPAICLVLKPKFLTNNKLKIVTE